MSNEIVGPRQRFLIDNGQVGTKLARQSEIRLALISDCLARALTELDDVLNYAHFEDPRAIDNAEAVIQECRECLDCVDLEEGLYHYAQERGWLESGKGAGKEEE